MHILMVLNFPVCLSCLGTTSRGYRCHLIACVHTRKVPRSSECHPSLARTHARTHLHAMHDPIMHACTQSHHPSRLVVSFWNALPCHAFLSFFLACLLSPRGPSLERNLGVSLSHVPSLGSSHPNPPPDANMQSCNEQEKTGRKKERCRHVRAVSSAFFASAP
jgi:hypothetical protein